MEPLTRRAIQAALGPIDGDLAAELLQTQASVEELREAYEWSLNDETPINEYRPLPKGRTAAIIDILGAHDFPMQERE